MSFELKIILVVIAVFVFLCFFLDGSSGDGGSGAGMM